MSDNRVAEVWEELDTLAPQQVVEVSRGLGVRRKASGIPVVTIHYSADPRRDPATPEGAKWYRKEKGNYPSQGDWDREQEIDDNAGGGELLLAPLLSKYGDKIIISDPRWEPDPRWECVEGMDHGQSNATAMVKMYIDFNGDRYACGEYYNWRRDPRGDDPGWGNEIWQNAPLMKTLHDLRKPRYTYADPSIFSDTQAQKDGTFTAINVSYRQNGVKFFQPYPSDYTRSDETFITRIREHWGGLDVEERQPTLYIVCRNDTGRRQPGLHPFDCPNLLWELRQAKRMELSDRQLLTANPTERVVQKSNHARDAFKYCEMPLPRPTAKPIEMQFAEMIQQTEDRLMQPLTPLSRAVAAQRFMALGAGRQPAKQVSMRNKARTLR